MSNIPIEVQEAITLVKQWGFAVLHRDHIMTAKAREHVSPEQLFRVENKRAFAEHMTKQLASRLADFLVFNQAAEFKDDTADADGKKRLAMGAGPIAFTAKVDVIKPGGFFMDFPALGLGKRWRHD